MDVLASLTGSSWRVICCLLAGLLTIAALAACGSDSVPTPVSSSVTANPGSQSQTLNQPPAAATRPAPAPVTSIVTKEPEPAPVPAVTPLVVMPSPTRASAATDPATITKAGQSAGTEASDPAEGPTFQISPGATWGDVYNSLSDEEQSCIRREMGEERKNQLLESAFALEDLEEESITVIGCVSDETAQQFFLADLDRQFGGLSDVQEVCVMELMDRISPGELAKAAMGTEPTPEQAFLMLSFGFGMAACIPEMVVDDSGSDVIPIQDELFLWSFSTGGWVLMAPAVADGVVYAASDDHSIYALDAETGSLLWSHPTDDVIRSTPTVVDGRVFFGSNDNHIYALEAATGTELWKYDTGDWVQYSPAVKDGKVYFGAPSDGDRKVHAVDAATGEVAWVAEHPFPIGNNHTPTPIGDRVYAQGAEYGQFFALDATTGSAAWQAEVGGYVESAPTVQDGVVYLTVANRAYAFKEGTGEIIWEVNTEEFPARDFPALVVDGVYYLTPSDKVYALDTTTGEELWSYESYMLSTAPVVADGVLYGASQDAEYLFALDAATGEELWTQPIEDFNAYTLAVVDGILYGQLDEGYLFAADTQGGFPIWEFETGGFSDIGVYSVTEGVVYSAGPNNSVYAHRAP